MWIWFVLASGIVNIMSAMLVNTENFPSALVFKVIPFFSGLGCLIYFLIEKNLIG